MAFMNYDALLTKLQAMPKRELIPMSEKTGISWHTLEKIWAGKTPNPRIRTVETLQRYFQQGPPPQR